MSTATYERDQPASGPGPLSSNNHDPHAPIAPLQEAVFPITVRPLSCRAVEMMCKDSRALSLFGHPFGDFEPLVQERTMAALEIWDAEEQLRRTPAAVARRTLGGNNHDGWRFNAGI